MGMKWRMLVVLAALGLGAGCSSSDRDETARAAMGEVIRARDWTGLKAQLQGGGCEPEAAWQDLYFALDKIQLSEAETDSLLATIADAKVAYVRPDGDELLQRLNPDVLAVPGNFWHSLSVEAQRDWVKRDIVREAIDSVVAGKPAGESARMKALTQKLKAIPRREGVTVVETLSGATSVGNRQVTYGLGMGRSVTVYVEGTRKWSYVQSVPEDTMMYESLVRGAVVFNAADEPVLFGVVSPLDGRESRRSEFPGIAQVKARLADGRDMAFDALVLGERIEGQLMIGITAVRGAATVWEPGNLVVVGEGPREPEPVILDAKSKEGRIAQLNPGYGTVSAEYRSVEWERFKYPTGFLMPIYWQDQKTGKVGLKAMLAQ